MSNVDSILQLVIPFLILFIVFGGAIAIIFYGIRQNRSIIERARKIDPSVKTISEAQYVLQKDMYQNFGSKKDNERKQKKS